MKNKLKRIVNPKNNTSFYILDNNESLPVVLMDHPSKIKPTLNQDTKNLHKNLSILSRKNRTLHKQINQVSANNTKIQKQLKINSNNRIGFFMFVKIWGYISQLGCNNQGWT